ncbi:MAG TPA: hypothetical protein VK487_05980, partial [Candidatus Bathyarchaeia archaeon]|nr:hypothetical protein [Candidatus Bathyarchaeia archaeon]
CVGKGVVQLADGSEVKIKFAYLYMKINGDHVFALCSYDGCPDPLLGFDVMHVLGLQVDTGKRQLLRPIRRFWLKSFTLNKTWISSRHQRRKTK